jgi:hypothetical protein
LFFKWLELDKGGVDDLGREPAYSTGNTISVAMASWNVGHRVFAVEQFVLETVILYLLSNVFSIESSMLSIEERFQIVTLYSNGLERLDLLDLS